MKTTLPITVDVQTMNTSKGADYFVRITCGDRSVTPHVFTEFYKAAYEVAHYSWVFGLREDKPCLLEYTETTHPNPPKVTKPATPPDWVVTTYWNANKDFIRALLTSKDARAQWDKLAEPLRASYTVRDAIPEDFGPRAGIFSFASNLETCTNG